MKIKRYEMKTLGGGNDYSHHESEDGDWCFVDDVEGLEGDLDIVTCDRDGVKKVNDRLRTERDNLLAALHHGHELLRAGVHQLSDLPPDTVLGESGTQAIRELDAARAAIGGMLANYPDHKATAGRVSTQREEVAHWTRKVMVEKRENARLRALRNAMPEWLGQSHGAYCVVCGANQDAGHKLDCEYALAATKAKSGKAIGEEIAREFLDELGALAEHDKLQRLVDEQAEDEALWFTDATAPEAYVQQALRRLHALIESAATGGKAGD